MFVPAVPLIPGPAFPFAPYTELNRSFSIRIYPAEPSRSCLTHQYAVDCTFSPLGTSRSFVAGPYLPCVNVQVCFPQVIGDW